MTRREFLDLRLIYISVQEIVKTSQAFANIIEPFKDDFNKKYKGKSVIYYPPFGSTQEPEVLKIEEYSMYYFKLYFFMNNGSTRKYFQEGDVELL